MPSENKTDNYGLNQWSGNEFVKREDFVTDNALIDAAIKDASDKADAAFTQASDGKNRIKTAIAGKDSEIEIPTDPTFSDLADAIGQIETGINTDDATATAGDILSGKTAYTKDEKITGNILSKGAQTYTPGTVNQTIGPKQYLSGAQIVLGDVNLVPDNIVAGKSIFGVIGSAIEGKRFATGVVSAGDMLGFKAYIGHDVITQRCYEYEGLTFKPNLIILFENQTLLESFTNITIYLDQAYLGGREIIFSATFGRGIDQPRKTHAFSTVEPAYVNEHGFLLPSGTSVADAVFYAFE